MVSKKIGIIGFGNMGSAFYFGLKEAYPDLQVGVYDRHSEKLNSLDSNDIFVDLNSAVESSEVLILAIKPQSFEEFANDIRVSLNNKLIISMMAGVSLKKISDDLGVVSIIRCMPNLPVKVRQGIVGWVSTSSLGHAETGLAGQIFSALGRHIELKDESMLNSLTLISGCGPAYFFRLAEMLENQAKKLGFSDEQAELLSQSTFIGSADLLQQSGMTSAEWKKAVASRGGVTEAALYSFEENGFEKVFQKGIEAAQQRNNELNL